MSASTASPGHLHALPGAQNHDRGHAMHRQQTDPGHGHKVSSHSLVSASSKRRALTVSESTRQMTGGSFQKDSRAESRDSSHMEEELPTEEEILEKHSLPAWNLFSGNLPVITTSQHNPRDGETVGPSPYDYFSGNLPVLSHVLHKTKGRSPDYLQPGWVQLQEPLGHKFWWNTKFRTRRERRPLPIDDGSEETVPYQGPIWIEAFDDRPEVMHRYYINMKDAYIQWSRPPEFDQPGMGEKYRSVWETQWNQEKRIPCYFNRKTLQLVETIPEGFDGLAYEQHWQSFTRGDLQRLLDRASSRRTTPDNVIKTDGSAGEMNPKEFQTNKKRVPPWVSHTLRNPLDDAAEHVGAGPGDVAVYVNTLSGEIRWDPPTPPPNPDEIFRDIEKPPLPEDAGNYEPPPNLDDPAVWGHRQFKDFSSWVKKRGGGRSMLGSTKQQKRYLVLKDGKLRYYKHEADAHSRDRKPQKNMVIDVSNYDVEQLPTKPRTFRLIPVEDRTALSFSKNSKHAPPPDRSFEFECEDVETAQQWLDALGEMTILSLEGSDSET
eukprot:gb/GECG01004790.1/.p1 GENE.gb/GECG01004790.1/~~gb/GECG01004790.1/.p1  ORF type:complete len:547 (+),score=56.13 gb/GECG01004790.1/:1-1641(+)